MTNYHVTVGMGWIDKSREASTPKEAAEFLLDLIAYEEPWQFHRNVILAVNATTYVSPEERCQDYKTEIFITDQLLSGLVAVKSPGIMRYQQLFDRAGFHHIFR